MVDGTSDSQKNKEILNDVIVRFLIQYGIMLFAIRSLDLFVASLLFRKGTSFCAIRRK